MEINDEEIPEQSTAKETEIKDSVPQKKGRLVQIPLAKVKSIMKFDSEGQLFSKDSVFLITKATELFLEYMARESYKSTQADKRKILAKEDVEKAIWSIPKLCFLDDALNF